MAAAGVLRPLRIPALVLIGALVGSGLVLYASGRFAASMEDAQFDLRRQLTEADVRLQRLHSQEASFRTDAESFRRLEARGLQGPERRLAWIQLLQTLPAQAGVDTVDYQLAAQRPYAHIPAAAGGVVDVDATQVSLQLGAVHEGRILDFLTRLADAAPGLLVVRSCQFSREDSQFSGDARAGSDAQGDRDARNVGRIAAHCLLDWMTLRQ